MGLLLLSTTFISLLVIGITFAVVLPAGSICPGNSGDTCATTTVCDKVHGKCLLLAEQTCTAGTEIICVSGGSCVSGACTCGAGYTKQTDKTCKPNTDGTVGFVCTSSGNECKTPNSECSTLEACKCKTGFVPNIENGKCDGIVGTTCTAADTCVASSVCDKVTGKCSIKDGQSCAGSGNDVKCVSSATCVSDVCKCDPAKAIPAATGLCLLKSGQTCTDKSSCVVGATCKTTTCECSNDFAENSTTKLCEAKAGTACPSDVTCVASSICESGTCLIKQGLSCAGNTDKCVSNAACVSNVCKCDDTKADPSTTGLCTLKNKASNSATLSFWLLLAALMSIFLVDYGM